MSDRFETIYKCNVNMYAEKSPIVVVAVALLYDRVSDRFLAQVKLKNIQNKPIKTVKISVSMYDSLERKMGDNVEYDIIDLFVERDDEFG